MPAFSVHGVLLDIEGTTSSIRFVYDVMFPYVREHLQDYLVTHWEETSLQSCLPQLAADLDLDLAQWLGDDDLDVRQQRVHDAVIGMMDRDLKATGLKQLQGMIWKAGFEDGQLVAHVYDDVAPALKKWQAAGLDIRIYSSGSVAAQRLFFGHSEAGNLLDRFHGHYDTSIGSKREVASYREIANEFGIPPHEILFVSDVIEELDAARQAGFQTALSIRPGNPPVLEGHSHPSITSFEALEFHPPPGSAIPSSF